MPALQDYLTGAGTWGTAGLWQPNAAVPVAGDTAVIPKSLANPVTDAGGAAKIANLAALYIHRGYTDSFGTDGASIATAADFAGIYSSGPVYLDVDNAAVAATLDKLLIAMANPNMVCKVNGSSGAAGELEWLIAQRGNIQIGQLTNWSATSEVRIDRLANEADVNLTIVNAISDTLPTFRQLGGTAHVRSRVTKGYVSNGLLTVSDTHISTLYVGVGGRVMWEDETVTGDNVSIHVHAGGFCDLLATAVPKEIDNLYLYPGSNARFDSEIITFTGTDGLKDYRGSAT